MAVSTSVLSSFLEDKGIQLSNKNSPDNGWSFFTFLSLRCLLWEDISPRAIGVHRLYWLLQQQRIIKSKRTQSCAIIEPTDKLIA